MTEYENMEDAMEDIEGSDTFAVTVGDGENGVHHLGRDKYGGFVIDTYVAAVKERKKFRVTREQVTDILLRGFTTQDGWVRMDTYDQIPLPSPAEDAE